MIRTLAAAAALATFTFAGAASAQTYGQPVYLDGYGRPVGGTPLSEVEARSYVQTGRRADGYSDRSRVYVPGSGYGSGRDHRRYGQGHSHDRSGHRYDPPLRAGYRDGWGYNDDRPPSAMRTPDDRRAHRHDGDCGCSVAYLYDR